MLCGDATGLFRYVSGLPRKKKENGVSLHNGRENQPVEAGICAGGGFSQGKRKLSVLNFGDHVHLFELTGRGVHLHHQRRILDLDDLAGLLVLGIAQAKSYSPLSVSRVALP